MAVAGTDWSKVKVVSSSSVNGREKVRRTYDGSGVVRNGDVDDESESGEGASKEFAQQFWGGGSGPGCLTGVAS
jgi:hypothetical protein